ncbi:MAG: hypothetical protein C5B59_06810 [Bacteroidetes bacterium]|nr:MAG: hypothetical protein C5B59_06810 [Bacteroidota bacterium]
MKKILVFFVSVVFVFSCSHEKKKGGTGEEVMDVHEFMKLFHTVSLPYQFSDTIFRHHATDSPLTFRTILQMLPDTVFSAQFGKTGRPKLYTIAKVPVKKSETYLYVKAIGAGKKVAYILSFDKDNKFVASMPLIISDGDPSVNWQAGMDAKYTITTNRQRKTKDGLLMYKKLAYVFNDAGAFTLILTESNEAKPKSLQVYNPIDTLPRKHKFSADYVNDKLNFVSVRDGRNSSYMNFFVHFEKDDGACKGELKGEARFLNTTTAQYRSAGDPCIVEFSFTPASVRMREVEGCGNHRDIKCFFEGTYLRQKESKAKSSKKKSK